MDFIDLHIHLQDYEENFATDIVKKAQKFGLKKMICAATSPKDWDKVAAFAQNFSDLIVPAFGVHPWHVAGVSEQWQNLLKSYLKAFPHALVGETGLDGLKPDFDLQQNLFSAQLKLAREFKRPIIIHSVKAVGSMPDFWHLMPAKFMIHSFNGRAEHLHDILSHGGYISFSASILKNRDIEKIVKTVPLNKILLESDGPYQAPNKGELSSPFFIPEILQHFASILRADIEELSRQIYQNSLEFIND